MGPIPIRSTMKKQKKMPKTTLDKGLAEMALFLAVHAVRNTVIEDYHSHGKISDPEMKEFNIEVVNKLYTLLQFYFNPHYQKERELLYGSTYFRAFAHDWNEPEFDKGFLEAVELMKREESEALNP